MTYRLGVDVGGTFTDVLLVEEATGETWRAKTASTPADQSVGVLNGIDQVCDAAGISLAEVAQVLHGTTVATNAILEGKGATRRPGDHQGLPAGAADRPVVRARRPGRLDHLAQARAARRAGEHRRGRRADRQRRHGRSASSTRTTSAPSWRSSPGVEALAVSLINSFADPAHERRIAEIAAEVLPDVPVSLSSDVLPEMREYERTVTTVANGYVQPQVKRYISTLSEQLHEGGITGELAILRSDGGLSAAEAATDLPGHDAALRPGRRGDRRGVDRRAVRLPRPDHLRHGRHLHRRRARAGPARRASAARPRSAT